MSGILLCLSFVFNSCEKEVAGDKGVLIPVKINGLRTEEGLSVDLLRSGSKNVVETARLPLGDGLFLDINLEQGGGALRDASVLRSMDDGTTYRLMAVDAANGELLALADGVVGGAFPELHVPDNATSCRFYALSYNSSTAIEPDDYEVGDILSPLGVDNSSDFLLWCDPNPTLSSGEYELDITFRQQLTKMNLIIDSSNLTDKTVEGITGVTIGSVAVSGTLDYKTGVLASSGTEGPQAFGAVTGGTLTTASSSLLIFPNTTPGTVTVTLPANSITLSGSSKVPSVSTPLPFYNTTLVGGNSYTIRLKLRKYIKSTKFASSNIYWYSPNNDDEGYLAFAPYTDDPVAYATMSERDYQGLCFKWGSLIGISPALTGGSTAFNSSTPVYKYNGSVWKRTTVANWDAIPAYNPTGSTGNRDTNYFIYNNIPDNPIDHTGDICRFIDSDYRLPTSNEIDYANQGNGLLWDNPADEWSSYGGTWPTFNDYSNLLPDGRYSSITWGGETFGIRFPTSGSRANDGTLANVGGGGGYWTGSAGATVASAYNLGFNYHDVFPADYGYSRAQAFIVRCVKN